MKKSLITTLLGITLLLSACQTAAPNGTTTPTGTTTPAGTAASNRTNAPATTQGSVTTTQTSSSGETPRQDPDDLTFSTYDDLITFDLGQVLDLWATEFPGGEITAIEFDYSDTSWYYVIDGIQDTKELSLRVDAITGEVRGREEENDDEDDKVIDFASIITISDALAIAQAETSPDTIVEEWKLEWDWLGTDTIWYDFELEDPDEELSVNAVDRTVKK